MEDARVVKWDLTRIDFQEEETAILHGTLPFNYGRVTVCYLEEKPSRRLHVIIVEDPAFQAKVEMDKAIKRGRWTWRRFFAGFFGIPRAWSSEPSWTPPETE